MLVFHLHAHICTIYMQCLGVLEPLGLELVMDGCEPLYGCWELSLGLLKEQQVLLTTKPSLQSLNIYLMSLSVNSLISYF